jgi:hypothetical protein
MFVATVSARLLECGTLLLLSTPEVGLWLRVGWPYIPSTSKPAASYGAQSGSKLPHFKGVSILSLRPGSAQITVGLGARAFLRFA